MANNGTKPNVNIIPALSHASKGSMAFGSTILVLYVMYGIAKRTNITISIIFNTINIISNAFLFVITFTLIHKLYGYFGLSILTNHYTFNT